SLCRCSFVSWSFYLCRAPSSSAPARRCSRLLRFYLPGFPGRGDCNFFAVVFGSTSQLRLDTAPEALRRYNDGRRAEAQNPGNKLEFAAHVHFHRNPATAKFTDLLRGMPHARAHVLGN